MAACCACASSLKMTHANEYYSYLHNAQRHFLKFQWLHIFYFFPSQSWRLNVLIWRVRRTTRITTRFWTLWTDWSWGEDSRSPLLYTWHRELTFKMGPISISSPKQVPRSLPSYSDFTTNIHIWAIRHQSNLTSWVGDMSVSNHCQCNNVEQTLNFRQMSAAATNGSAESEAQVKVKPGNCS